MDDFNVSALHESKNEWGARLLTILTPCVIEGFRSILEQAVTLCRTNGEMDKYLMTFQNLISHIPKWNASIIETERKRIIERSGCKHLDDLISCVHIIHLKLLTAVRVGQKQKKIDINIPKLDDFIHKVYIFSARKLYKNVYLFKLDEPPLQIQRNGRELEYIVQECILGAIRESIPDDQILRLYMDETEEENVVEEIKEIEQPVLVEKINPSPSPLSSTDLQQGGDNNLSQPVGSTSAEQSFVVTETPTAMVSSGIKFNDYDSVHSNGSTEIISAPKDIARLEEISAMRNQQRKMAEEEDDDDFGGGNGGSGGLKILGDVIPFDIDEVEELGRTSPVASKQGSAGGNVIFDDILGDIEVLS